MGDNFLLLKSQAFKHRRSKRYEELLQTPNLFSGSPDLMKETYHCILNDEGTSVSKGQRVFIVDQGDAALSVMVARKVVGYVDEAGSEKIRDAFAADPRAAQILLAEVDEVFELSGSFDVVLRK